MNEYSILGKPEYHYGEVQTPQSSTRGTLVDEYLKAEEMKSMSEGIQRIMPGERKGSRMSPLEGAVAMKELGDYDVLEEQFKQAGIPIEIIQWGKANRIPPDVLAAKMTELLEGNTRA